MILNDIFPQRPRSALSCLAAAALALTGTAACSLGGDGPAAVNLQPPREPIAADAASGETIVVHSARVAAVGSPEYNQRLASLPPPPPGPMVSRLVVPETTLSLRAGPEPPAPVTVAAATPPPAPPAPEPAPPPPVATPVPSAAPAAAPAAVPAAAAPAASATAPSVRWQSVPEVPMAAAAPQSVTVMATPPAPADDAALAVIPFAALSPNLTDATRKQLDEVAKQIADKGLRRIELRAFATGDLDARKIALARALVVRSYLLDRKVKARLEVGSFDGQGEYVEILVPRS